MNAVEIEEAVSKLAEQPFDAAEFPYAFLEAFGNKANTIKRLRSTGKSTTNKTDVNDDGVVAVLQRNNIHVAALNPVAEVAKTFGPDAVSDLLKQLTGSPATAKHKAKFALATNGGSIQAENLNTGETLVCDYAELADHFGFFLELAGISTVRQIRENAFDIKATGRLNRLYVELLRHNPDWDGNEHREQLNHFFARLIFCFFAEDTGIFRGNNLFTETVRQMSEPSGKNTHFVLAEIFRALDTRIEDRDRKGRPSAGSGCGDTSENAGSLTRSTTKSTDDDAEQTEPLRSWAGQFPYVNGGLFGGGASEDDVPEFTQIARSYLLHIGSLDWTRINPDIFGSMIQAVAEDEERGALGMHYTSVPNILKVLNPLFLDELRTQLDEAGDNRRKLLNLRKRLARIRVFDPACGSGNFLVIAYKQMREIEAEINRRRGEADRATDIPLTNFRGIEIRHFAAEVARLALVIAEYQCDELHRGQRLALAEFLPLDNQNWITHGNALRLDWLKVCPPTGTSGVKLTEDDLFQTPLDQPEFDFENEGGETYICGNPPYLGAKWQSKEQKADLAAAWQSRPEVAKNSDFVTGWIAKFLDYSATEPDVSAAFVSTNSLCQGQQASTLWPVVFERKVNIGFARLPFKWANLASYNAGVIVCVVGLSRSSNGIVRLFDGDAVKTCTCIGPYLTPDSLQVVAKEHVPISNLPPMLFGNMPRDGGHLLLTQRQAMKLSESQKERSFVRRFVGSKEIIRGVVRYCIWIEDDKVDVAADNPFMADRLKRVAMNRAESSARSTQEFAKLPYRFVQIAGTANKHLLAIPRVSSESRDYLPVDHLSAAYIVGDSAFALYDAPLWCFSLIASRLHLVWVATVCGKLKTDYRYSNTLGWNTFPVPPLSGQNRADLTEASNNILLARETHWPATISELYDTESMPDDLRTAHDKNDETLERIYIGRKCKNDSERRETLFSLYTEIKQRTKNHAN